MGGISIGKNNLTDSSVGDPSSINKENSQIAIGRDNVATHLDTIALSVVKQKLLDPALL